MPRNGQLLAYQSVTRLLLMEISAMNLPVKSIASML